MDASRGNLVVLTGPVGSGKSSLIAAINREVAVTEGKIFCAGTIAYVSQTPWVFAGTIRENILFGEDYDKDRFEAVVKVCALKTDLEMFPDGELTIVGEKGAVLSGGQRARVSLARAVYIDADLYIMDDPLSAVDAKVSQYIFEECICGLLSAKTRLLVTHQTNHMEKADQIIVLSHGAVLTRGSFVKIKETGVLDTDADSPVTETPDSRKETNEERDKKTSSPALTKRMETGLEVPEEDRSIGTVTLQLYWDYFRAGQPAVALMGLVVVFLLAQCESVDYNI